LPSDDHDDSIARRAGSGRLFSKRVEYETNGRRGVMLSV